MADARFDPAEKVPAPGAKDRTRAHLWLQRMLGEWTTESDFPDEQGKPTTATGRESVRKIGEYWIQSTSTMTMPDDGTPGEFVVTLGFDPNKGKFVGAWVCSMMPGIWVYEGQMAPDGTLVLETEGEAMEDDTTIARYRDAFRFASDDLRTQISYVLDGAGEWVKFGEFRARRAR